MFLPKTVLRDQDDTQLGSFPGGSGAPATNFNPFDSNAGAPPAPTNPDGSTKVVMDPITRTREEPPARHEPPVQRQEPPVRQQTPPPPPTQQQQTPPAQQQPPAAPDRTEALLQQLADRLRPTPTPPPQAAPPPQMTDEEFARQFNIHKVTAEEYEAILGIKPDSPARVAALDAALQGISRQSVTLARAMIEQAKQELGLQIQPAREAILRQEAQRQHAEFVKENDDLKDYTPLLQEIVASSQARLARGEPIQLPDGRLVRGFANEVEARQFVAQKARALLRLPVSQQGGQQQQQQQRQQSTPSQQGGSRSMSTTSMGGRTGQSGGAAPVQGLAERLFSEQPT